jgi:ribosomal protein S11
MVKKYRFKNYKNHFFFGSTKQNFGKLYIKRTYTNVFITLCDLNSKVIACHTSGSTEKLRNKRRKRIAQAVEKIILKLYKIIKFYKIVKIHIILKMKVKSHVYTLINKLKHYGLEISSVCSLKSIAHNGVRGKKLRRL